MLAPLPYVRCCCFGCCRCLLVLLVLLPLLLPLLLLLLALLLLLLLPLLLLPLLLLVLLHRPLPRRLLKLLMIACYEGAYGMAGSIIFFVTYEVITVFVLVNMFVMVIVSTFDEVDVVEEEFELQRIFKQAWQPLDPQGTGFVPVDQLLTFLEALGPK